MFVVVKWGPIGDETYGPYDSVQSAQWIAALMSLLRLDAEAEHGDLAHFYDRDRFAEQVRDAMFGFGTAGHTAHCPLARYAAHNGFPLAIISNGSMVDVSGTAYPLIGWQRRFVVRINGLGFGTILTREGVLAILEEVR